MHRLCNNMLPTKNVDDIWHHLAKLLASDSLDYEGTQSAGS